MTDWASPDPGPVPGPSDPPSAPPSAPHGPPAQTGSVPAWAQTTRRGVVPLRPLTLGEILDGAVTTVRRYPGALLGLGALAAVLSAVSQLLQDQGVSDAAKVALTILSYAVSTVVSIALSGAAALVLRAALLGDPMSASAVLTALRPRLWRLVGAALLSTLLATLALVAFVVPGVYLYTAWSVTGAVVALEDAGVRTAMARSRYLIRGAWWRTFGILALTVLIVGAIASVIAIPAVVAVGVGGGLFNSDAGELSTGGQLAVALSSAVASLITAPFSACVHALIYTDRRMRIEGLDVALQQSLAERAG